MTALGRAAILAALLLLLSGFRAEALPDRADGPLGEAERQALFNEGNDFFSRANTLAETDPEAAAALYRQAVLRFERLVDPGGVRNGKLYYNLGNGYFRLHELGRAVLSYRLAERYIPDDPNLRQNLAVALGARQDRIEKKEEERVLETVFFWHYDLSPQARALVFSVSFLLFWALAALRLFYRSGLTSWGLGAAAAAAALFLGSLLVTAHTRAAAVRGVLLAPETVARQGDGPAFAPSFSGPLHAGTEFTLREDRGAWLRVELDDGRQCWVPAGSAGLVQ